MSPKLEILVRYLLSPINVRDEEIEDFIIATFKQLKEGEFYVE